MSRRGGGRGRALGRKVAGAVAALLLSSGFLFAGVLPAAAHKLKVFATVEAGAISGFAFFVGGGRPQGAHVMFRDADGRDLATAFTDQEGAFSFVPAKAEDVTVVVDAGDGHSAETHITADRLAPLALTGGAAGAAMAATLPPTPAGTPAAAPLAACDPALIARLVDEAVARHLRPLEEAQAQSEDKVRFKDVVGGIGMIVGLFGAAMWASARAKARAPGAGA